MSDPSFVVEPGKKFKLSSRKTDQREPFEDKKEGSKATEKLVARLGELQEVLYADAGRAVLIVLQGMDTSGKDGAIEHVFGAVNPQGCQVTSFKVPSTLEASHDYLWRVHAAVPARGMIGIFNRSHYESVLVERVKKLVPREVWSRRYEQINSFEKMLSDEGVTIIKFFLNISRDEQKQRLQARLDEADKHWKFDPHDLEVRKQWDEYMDAYEEALEKCSTKHAPWHVVPSDHKWFRNWVISDTIVRAVEKLDLRYPAPVPGIEKIKID